MPRDTKKNSELYGGEILNKSSSDRNLADKISAGEPSASKILRSVNLKRKTQNGEQALILNDKICKRSIERGKIYARIKHTKIAKKGAGTSVV